MSDLALALIIAFVAGAVGGLVGALAALAAVAGLGRSPNPADVDVGRFVAEARGG